MPPSSNYQNGAMRVWFLLAVTTKLTAAFQSQMPAGRSASQLSMVASSMTPSSASALQKSWWVDPNGRQQDSFWQQVLEKVQAEPLQASASSASASAKPTAAASPAESLPKRWEAMRRVSAQQQKERAVVATDLPRNWATLKAQATGSPVPSSNLQTAPTPRLWKQMLDWEAHGHGPKSSATGRYPRKWAALRAYIGVFDDSGGTPGGNNNSSNDNQLPNSYKMVEDWARTEASPPPEQEMWFQLRNTHVAQYAQQGRSRWGPAENGRARFHVTEMHRRQQKQTQTASSFRLRNANVAAFAAARKSRWGELENARAAAQTAATPSPVVAAAAEAAPSGGALQHQPMTSVSPDRSFLVSTVTDSGLIKVAPLFQPELEAAATTGAGVPLRRVWYDRSQHFVMAADHGELAYNKNNNNKPAPAAGGTSMTRSTKALPLTTELTPESVIEAARARGRSLKAQR